MVGILSLNRIFRGLRVLYFNSHFSYGPLCIDVSITSRCNYRCFFCKDHSYLRGAGNIEDVEGDVLDDLLEDLIFLKVKEIVFSGDGEPLMDKRLPGIIDRYWDKFRIGIVSNGSCLSVINESLFNKIGKLSISLNSVTPSIHKSIHGYSRDYLKRDSHFPTIAGEIERLLHFSREKIQINYVLCRENIEELPKVLALARQWKVYFAIRPVVGVSKNLMLTPTDLLYAREELSGAGDRVLKKTVNHALACLDAPLDTSIINPCYFGFLWGNVSANGDYQLCTYGPVIGNVKEKRFKDIWKSMEIQGYLSKALNMYKTNDLAYLNCDGCVGHRAHSAIMYKYLKYMWEPCI